MSGRHTWGELRRPGNPHVGQGFSAAIDAAPCLSERLGVTQSWLSQIEHQTDVQLSTLSAYIGVLGGRPRLVASLSGDRAIDLRHMPSEQQEAAAVG